MSLSGDDRGPWTRRWQDWRNALLAPAVDAERLDAALREARARLPPPVIWLIGKTQSGKSSIVRALTGSTQAEIGNGFQACTARAYLYDFPGDVPLVRFLDTRGLGEVAYDPAEDIRFCESQAHLLLAVMRAGDLRQDEVFQVLREVRTRHPEWPLVIAQTHLHEAYRPDGEHLLPYPFEQSPWPPQVDPDLARLLRAQRAAAPNLPGGQAPRWVPVDLTLPEDGFDPPDYGLDALWRAIDTVSSLHLQTRMQADTEVSDLYARAAHPHILGYALAASGVGALPGVDLVGVPGIQAKMLHSLAALYGQEWNRRGLSEFMGLLGAGIALAYAGRAAGRGLVKFIPVWGQTVGALWGASASAATTYALGRAAALYFDRRRRALPIDAATLRQAYREALQRGATLLQDLRKEPPQ